MALDFGAIIIGAGVVGSAVARELAKACAPVLVVEREAVAGAGISSRNSGVLHAGFHHPPHWLKGRLCIEGRRLLVPFMERKGVRWKRCGKLLVACDEEESARLEVIHARGLEAGIEGLSLLGRAELRDREPELRGVAALWSGVSGVLDPHELGVALRAEAEDDGALIMTQTTLVGAEGGFVLHLDDGGDSVRVESPIVVNAAGLDADRVASLFGLDGDKEPLRQRFVKGHYFRVAARHRGRVQHLIYPLPPRDLEGLGVHLTLDLDGGVRLGPDAVDLPERVEDYSVPPSLAGAFLRSARRTLPFLEEGDLSPDMAGIRPKLGVQGSSPSDFLIREESERGLPGLVTLCGIESPGLSSCLAIAREVRRLLGV